MFHKKHLGWLMIGAGSILGTLAVLMMLVTRGQMAALFVLLLASLASAGVGSILVFTQALDRFAKPVVEEINADVADDIEDLKAKRGTNAQFMLLCTGAALLVFLYFILKLHKIEASWGGLPVIVLAGIVLLIGTWIVVSTSWFRDQSRRTPLKIYFIPLVGLVISVWLGLGRENPQAFALVETPEIEYNNFVPPALDFMDFSFSSGISLDCDDDACGVIVLFIALVTITLLLVAGSASIPHFWVLSGMVLLAILAIITIHELRVRKAVGERGHQEKAAGRDEEKAGVES